MPDKSDRKILKQYNESFALELKRLNAGQQQAVGQIEGPVLVIAGPGTGKTHILTARIGRILMDTDAQAGNILCLTFTDAGVHAMRERLLQFIGPEAHRVHIYTFHSFCNNVIKDNLELFGRYDLEPISDLERVELVRALLDDLPSNHLLRQKTSDPYFYEKHLQDLFKRMKSEAWTADFIHNKIDAYLKDLPLREEYIYKVNRKEFKKGDLKAWKIDEANRRMQLLGSAIDLYSDYTARMEAAQRYDYEDMILWVLNAFENNEALLLSYQERYHYFLVDEYQDTNGAQNSILKNLIAYWESPNVFIVGDDDQSIFEFQGARLKNLVNFHNEHEADLNLVILKDNYRSSQNILDASRSIIDNNQNRIVSNLDGVEKVLEAQNDLVAKSSVQVQIIAYPNRVHEEAALVMQIEALQKADFPLKEVAIIYAKHKQAINLITLLEKKNIPYNTKREVNLLDLPLVRNIRLLLQYIQLESVKPFSGEHLLFKILHFNFLGIAARDLSKISLHIAGKGYKEKTYWRTFIGDEAQLGQLGLQKADQLTQSADLIDQLVSDQSNYSLPAFFERVINRSGLLSHLVRQDDKTWQLQVLNTFMNFIKTECLKDPRLSLKRFLDLLGIMDNNRLPLSLQKSILAADGVNLITAHSSKGLEFQHVFILDTVKDQWEPGKSRGGRRFPFPDTLTLSGEEDAMEARRRLFYVAVTRAKEHLHLSFANKNAENKVLQHAIFIDEIMATTEIPIEQKEVPADVVLEAQHLSLLESEAPSIPGADKAMVDSLLENFTLSISSLNRFLKCPLSFYYEVILHLPTVQSEAASYGTAMHFALMRLFERMRADEEKRFPDIDLFITFFEEEMKRQRGYFTKKEYERRLEIGRKNLTAIYEQQLSSWPKSVLIEHDVRQVEYKGVPLTGTIDRIDLNEKHEAHIADYKTGRIDSKNLQKPSEANPLGGTYWRQLHFYKILYEAAQVDRKATSASIVYLEEDKTGHFPVKEITFDLAHVQMVKDMIVNSWKKIQAHEFYKGCGEKNCTWCNFLRDNTVVESLVNREVEELDD